MHITKKILDDISGCLLQDYKIYIPDSDWDLFKEPIRIIDSYIDIDGFIDRMEKSVDVITKILDIHGKGDVVKFLGELASIEHKIQELQPWVRDHIVHAINTFIIGVYIMKNIDMPDIEVCNNKEFIWKICGPTHDLGYPLEISHNIGKPFIEKLNEILSNINSDSPNVCSNIYPENINMLCNEKDANELIQYRLTEWGLDLSIKDYYIWIKENNKLDHGVISALAQLKVIDALYQKHNPTRSETNLIDDNLNYNQKFFILDNIEAATAIFIHNIDIGYENFKNKIDFKLAPFAFILFLCDTFQEWDRYSENRKMYSGNEFDIVCSNNLISLSVPEELKETISLKLTRRLKGLCIEVNNKVVVV